MPDLNQGDTSMPRSTALAFGLSLALACGPSSLDALDPAPTIATGSSGSGSTLPPLETGHDPGSTGNADGRDSDEPGPGECAPGCRMTLPIDWMYEGSPDLDEVEPGSHRVPAMVREADGTITVAEQRGDWATLHRLDRWGRLQWNRPLPLPCDRCDLGDVALHPSGDLLLSATGTVIDGEYALLAGRWDPRTQQLVWATTRPLQALAEVNVRGGDIVAVSDVLAAQLYVEGVIDFQVRQITGIVVYGDDGTLIDDTSLAYDDAMSIRRPLLAHPTPDGGLAVAIPRGFEPSAFSSIDRMQAPLWGLFGAIFVPEVLDEMIVDARDHSLELGHSFDGAWIHLVAADRPGLEITPRWVATMALASTTDSRAAMAVGPEGDLYAAIRTTQLAAPLPEPPPDPPPEPLARLSVVRWSPEGELRWQVHMLTDIQPSTEPLAMKVGDDGHLVVASIVDDRLRVERWEQRCSCE